MRAARRTPSPLGHRQGGTGVARSGHSPYFARSLGPRDEQLLRAAEYGVNVPSGMERCVVTGGGFSGTAKEFGLMRVRAPRDASTELYGMPCSINPLGEVGIMRLPQRADSRGPPFLPSERDEWERWKAENRSHWQGEVERRVRLRLEANERKREQENAADLAGLFNRLGAKYGEIQKEKIEARRREIALAHFEIEKMERARLERAVIKVQSIRRGILARRRYAALLAELRKTQATKHQKAMRERLHRFNVRRRYKAAVDIQRVWKGWRARLRYQEIRAMAREDFLGRRMRSHLSAVKMEMQRKATVLQRQRLQITDTRRRDAEHTRLRELRACILIQSWWRGYLTRLEVKRLRLLHRKLDDDAANDLVRLRRIQREAVQTSSTLTGHRDMTMVNRARKRRDIEDRERLTDELRKVREVARMVEDDLQRHSESEVVPLRELNEFLEARQLREQRDKARREADEALYLHSGTKVLRAVMDREQSLQDAMHMKEDAIDLSRLRYEARRIQKDMIELNDGAEVYGQLRDFKRELDSRVSDESHLQTYLGTLSALSGP